MRKNWKDRSGVSPIIAAILLVGITVVLSSVLYVWVMGMGDDEPPAPVASGALAENVDERTIKVTFGTMSQNVDFIQCKFTLGVDNSVALAQSIVGTGTGSTLSFTPVDGGATYTVTFQDVNGDGGIGMGDNAEIVTSSGSLASGTYTAYLLWAADGSPICSPTLQV